MTSRREMLRLAAAFGAAAPLVPFAVSPDRAAALLDEPAVFSNEFQLTEGRYELDPVEFADITESQDWFDWFSNGNAIEFAEYTQALDRLRDSMGLTAEHLGTHHPVVIVDEAAVAMWTAAWFSGIRAGAAYEHLRLAHLSARMTCQRCHGRGRLWSGRAVRTAGLTITVCDGCNGAGHVATPPARLSGLEG